MKKFDIRKFLTENKLTEVSRIDEKMSTFRDLEGKTVKMTTIRNDDTVQIFFKDGTVLEFTNDGNASILGESKKSLNEQEEIKDRGIRNSIIYAIDGYMSGDLTRDNLVKQLRKIEKDAKRKVGADRNETLWWRAFKDDTGVTDIDNVERTLSRKGPNKETMLDDFNDIINKPKGFSVYIS